MKKILIFPSYLWAIVCVILIPATFMGNDFFARQLATMPFMKVNPIYTGGDSLRSYRQDSLKITVNKPVFEALVGTSRKGFVQVKYAGNLPENLQGAIDYDNDGKSDFSLCINTLTGKTEMKPLSKFVLGLDVSSRVKDCWVVRVKLLNKNKK